MSFRDESLALRSRLEVIEPELARAEGHARGLAVALAEAEERAEALEKRAIESKWPRRIANALVWVAGVTVGLLGGALVSGAGCMVIPAIEECNANDARWQVGIVESSSRDAAPVGSVCTVVLVGQDEECRGIVRCGDEALWDGTATCAWAGGSLLSWDASVDDTPALVVAEAEQVAAVRTRHDLISIRLFKVPRDP